jgi:hypothetical protein
VESHLEAVGRQDGQSGKESLEFYYQKESQEIGVKPAFKGGFLRGFLGGLYCGFFCFKNIF